MTEVGLLSAFVAGALSLISPCSALLLPSFFAYAFTGRTALVARTGLFYVGLLLTLVPLGTGAAAASMLFYGHRQQLIAVAGWLIIAMGVLQIVLPAIPVPFAGRVDGRLTQLSGEAAARSARGGSRLGAWASTLLLGAVYGLAGFCSGPVLGAILTLAATQRTPLLGGTLLAVYALGMALPLFLLALAWDRFDLGSRRWLRGRPVRIGGLATHSTALISGPLFIAIGVVFLVFDGTAGIVGMLGLGDTTDVEVAAQQAVSGWLGAIPTWAVLLAVAVIAGGVAIRRAASAPADHAEPTPAPTRRTI